MPRVERLARELLLCLGAPIFFVPPGSVPGRYMGLGVLFAMLLERSMGESWARFLDTSFTSQVRMNYRNELLHGSVDEVSQVSSALTLVAALHLSVGVAPSAAPPATSQPGPAAPNQAEP